MLADRGRLLIRNTRILDIDAPGGRSPITDVLIEYGIRIERRDAAVFDDDAAIDHDHVDGAAGFGKCIADYDGGVGHALHVEPHMGVQTAVIVLVLVF